QTTISDFGSVGKDLQHCYRTISVRPHTYLRARSLRLGAHPGEILAVAHLIFWGDDLRGINSSSTKSRGGERIVCIHTRKTTSPLCLKVR
ncbi:unnamed protein product, partial [Ectocarpus fasciculatus]